MSAICGIYKITNLKNNKNYIGQSINIARRWGEHKRLSIQKIDKDIQKYGAQYFSFSILEQCKREELNKKEEWWINFFNSMEPNGYNQTKPNVINSIIRPEEINNIIQDLKQHLLTREEIAQKYSKKITYINKINRGELWFDSKELYPLNKPRTEWSDREKETLRILVENNYSLNEISNLLKRSINSIKVQSVRLGIKRKHPYYKQIRIYNDSEFYCFSSLTETITFIKEKTASCLSEGYLRSLINKAIKTKKEFLGYFIEEAI